MGDIEDVPVVGSIVGTGSILLDVALNGSLHVVHAIDLVLSLILGQPELLVGILSGASQLAGRFGWLPTGTVESIGTAALVSIFVLSIRRFVSKAIEKKTS